MIITEEEAKTKWCPEVRTGLNDGMAIAGMLRALDRRRAARSSDDRD